MSKQNTGYANVIPQFAKVIGILEELKTNWNPINDQLTIEQLKARHEAAKPFVDSFNVAFEFDKIKTSEREKAYLPLNSLLQRIVAAATNCKMDATIVEQVKTYKSLIDGTNVGQATAKREEKKEKLKATLAEGENLPENNARSVSKQTYDLRFENFKRLITLLTTAGTYKTNVPDLTLAALNDYADTLAAANTATAAANEVWAQKLKERNACLSAKEDSILSVVKDIKTELVSMETKKGDNFKAVAALKFMSFTD